MPSGIEACVVGLACARVGCVSGEAVAILMPSALATGRSRLSGIGMVLGVMLGLIPIPIPGVGKVTLGITGGPLIVALILGKLRRTGPMLWVMPLPANIVLRNFGLALFLAAVGINAGQPFVKTVSDSGMLLLLDGVVVLLSTVIIVLAVGYYVLKIPFDDLVGVASGATGNPAILAYSTRMAPTERPDIGYAMIFPSMTLVKVIAVQIVQGKPVQSLRAQPCNAMFTAPMISSMVMVPL